MKFNPNPENANYTPDLKAVCEYILTKYNINTNNCTNYYHTLYKLLFK